jgi:hypothetical protein
MHMHAANADVLCNILAMRSRITQFAILCGSDDVLT